MTEPIVSPVRGTVRRLRDGLLVVGEYTAEALYGLTRTEWRRTGATEEEARRRLPGDELVPGSNHVVTRAESIGAPPEQVWPWLMQMGYGRGGFYGDFPWWRDPDRHRGVRSSATAVHPEFQHLEVGDVLLDGPNCDEHVGAWRVRVLDPGHALVLSTSRTPLSGREVSSLPRRPRAFFDCSWAFVLVREDGGTRLLVRSRVRMHPPWLLRLTAVIRAGDTVMQRAMLAGIKRRLERHGDRPDPGVGLRRSRLTLGELATVWVDEPVAPFQIALAGQFDATPFLRDDGTVDLQRIRAELVRRAGRVPALRRRVVWTPVGRGRPYWTDDADFDPGRHVACASLPAGVSFIEWCAQQIVEPLDRDRPLWRAAVVPGLPGARFGALIVLHHAVADGLTGVALAASLMDAVPEGGLPDRPAPRPGPAAPSAAAPSTAPPRRSLPARLRQHWRQLVDAAADFRTPAPVTSLSRPIGAHRRLATVSMPLQDVHQAGLRLGVSVNDLLLAAVSGGLRELLAGRGDELTGLVLRTSMPVGARGAGQATGILLVGLPVGDPDPLSRLAAIHREATLLKTRLQAGGGDVLDVLHLPTPAARTAVRWMRRIAGRRVNLFVTNVPGPAAPLELAGARLLEAVPIAPLVRGVPLGIAALSYAGTLNVSIDADAAIDDLEVLTRGIERSVAVLLDAAASGARMPTTRPADGGRRGIRGVVENSVDIDREPAEVFTHCADPTHELGWNPQLRAVEQLTGGPLGAGTRFRMTFGHGAGDSTLTYTRFDPPRAWAAHSTSPRLDVHAEGDVVPVGSGSRLVVRTDLRPHGPLRPLAPLLRRYMHSAWNRNLAVIKAQLENRDPEKHVAP
jgi:WS/DGAT/MGAT family acyltransferase